MDTTQTPANSPTPGTSFGGPGSFNAKRKSAPDGENDEQTVLKRPLLCNYDRENKENIAPGYSDAQNSEKRRAYYNRLPLQPLRTRRNFTPYPKRGSAPRRFLPLPLEAVASVGCKRKLDYEEGGSSDEQAPGKRQHLDQETKEMEEAEP